MSVREVKIFVSSPGDVNRERALAFRVSKRLQRDFVQHFRLIPVFWEKLPLEAADCFQAEIERISSPAEADVVVFILWSRLGTPLGLQFHKPDGSPYGSGTEYEFEVSLKARRDTGKPAILVYIKEAPIEPGKFSLKEVHQLSEIQAQAHKVKDFIEQRFYDPQEKVFIRSYHTFKETPGFESLLEDHLRELLSQFLPEGAAARPLWEGTPFRGLQVFDYQHEEIFCGRSQAVMEIMNLLSRQAESGSAFALVLGRSGSGKSSLVRAGVLPLLTRYGVMAGVKVWRWTVITPAQSQGDLFEGLAAGILGPTALPELSTQASRGAELAQVLRESPTAALVLLRDCLGRLAPAASDTGGGAGPPSRLVLVIDQLEEIFDAAVTAEQRQAYVRVLLTLAGSGLVWVLATLRSDYYQRCAELPDLMALKKDGTYDLAPPSPAELQQIITRPAAMAGLRFELRSPGGEPLDQHIFNAVLGVEAGLPLLEYTLEELYERRTPEGWLTYQAYDETGGVEGALGRRAEAVFTALPQEVQAAFPEVFQELTAIAAGETERVAARSASWEELTASPARRQLVEAMVANRLFSADSIKDSAGASRAVVRVAHEALFRAWERLTDWLEQEKENLRVRSRVELAAERWQAEGRRPDLLLPAGKPLEEALPLASPGHAQLPPAEQEFIRASQARSRRFRRLKQTAVTLLIVLTFLAVGGAFLADHQRRQAQAKEIEAQHHLGLVFNEKAAQAAQALKWNESRLYSLMALARFAPGRDLEDQVQAYSRLIEQPHFPIRDKARLPSAWSVAFSRDGRFLASGSLDGAVRLWDAATHQVQANFTGHQDLVRSLAFSPDGRLLASASEDKTVRLWDLAGRQPLVTLTGHLGSVYNVAFSPDGRLLASGSGDKTVRLWDLDSHKLLATLTGHEYPVVSVAFSPDGRLLASGSADETVRLWDVSSRQVLATLTAPDSFVTKVAFSPDGRVLASASGNGKVRLWDVSSHQVLATFSGHDGQVESMAFSPDGRLLASGSDDNTVRLWDVAGRQLLATLTGQEDQVNSVAFSSDGNILASASRDETLYLWDVSALQVRDTLTGHKDRVISVAFSPDGRFLASGSRDKTICLWDVSTRRALATLTGHEEEVACVAWSPDGRVLASASWDKTVRLWDVAGRLLLATLTGHEDMLNGLAWSPDGRILASSSDDKTVRLWDVVSRQALATLAGHGGEVRSVAFSPDGRVLASGSGDKTVRLWDLDSHKVLATLTGHEGMVRPVAFSPDGRLLASASDDKTVRLWDMASRRTLATLTGHEDKVNGLAFSPNGRILASASWDKTVRLWDVPGRRALATLTGHKEAVSGVAFSPDGRVLASASWDETVRLWDLTTLFDRRPWPERLAEAEGLYHLHLVGLDLKPIGRGD